MLMGSALMGRLLPPEGHMYPPAEPNPVGHLLDSLLTVMLDQMAMLPDGPDSKAPPVMVNEHERGWASELRSLCTAR